MTGPANGRQWARDALASALKSKHDRYRAAGRHICPDCGQNLDHDSGHAHARYRAAGRTKCPDCGAVLVEDLEQAGELVAAELVQDAGALVDPMAQPREAGAHA